MNTIAIFEPDRWPEVSALPQQAKMTAFAHSYLNLHRPDHHLVCFTGGVVSARCSCWAGETPPMADERPGLIGHFAAADAKSCHQVLAASLELLRKENCTMAIGPMDGNTWRRYRWVTDWGEEPPFLMEPTNPCEYPIWWQDAGFMPLARYQSALSTHFQTRDPRLDRVRQRLRDQGVAIRPLALDRFEDELRLLHGVSLAGFTNNFLYTPLSEEDFFALYVPYREKIRPEFVLLAMQGERCVGFLFAIPDYLRPAAGHPLDTIIVKTAVILPGRSYAGLGNLLAETVHHAAVAAGMTRAIHALAHTDNPVTNLTARFASVIRGYTLYAHRIAS